MTIPNIHQRLHAVMQKCDYLQREKKPGMQYKIVSHDAVTAYVRPVLVENGVVYYPVAMTRHQDGNRTEIDLTLRFVNIEQPSDYIDVVGCGYGVDQQDKGPGKAISYAVKYCLLKALGLETGDDPDETQGKEADHKDEITTRIPRPTPTTPLLDTAKSAQETAAQFVEREAREILTGIRAPDTIDKLDQWMDASMDRRHKLPQVTQQYLSKTYVQRREAMIAAS